MFDSIKEEKKLSLVVLWRKCWGWKWILIISAVGTGILSMVVSLILPDIYSAEVTILAPEAAVGGGLAGGLMAAAAQGLGKGQEISSQTILALLKSGGEAEAVIKRFNIAEALGHIARRMGYEVLFTKAVKMFRHLNGGRADNSFERRMKRYTSVHLLIIDDFGLKPLTPTQSDDFYEVISERYMKKSIIFTGNRAIEDWQGLFPDPIIANSVMDRIAHNAHQIIITGESYRNKKGEEIAKKES